MNNGYTAFQCGFDGTNLMDEEWLRKRENTVKATEKSSLHIWALFQEEHNQALDGFLDVKDYAICGGGFPIHVEEVGVVGTIAVSGLDHVADHDLLIRCISRYLHVDEIPRIKSSIF
ncbi:MAG TPA: heme-binding protein, partial [Candidatus Merdenecus merdavium]|nr:heme-binding protein [Candidatus Merdenecus merdavium]